MPRRPTLNKAGCDLSGKLQGGATKAIPSDCFLKQDCVGEQLALTLGVCSLPQDSGPQGFWILDPVRGEQGGQDGIFAAGNTDRCADASGALEHPFLLWLASVSSEQHQGSSGKRRETPHRKKVRI